MAGITRAEVASLISEEYSGQTIKAATQGSTALQAFPTVNMGTKTRNMPVLATIPEASWVSDTDNTGVKGQSKATWANQTLLPEEVAVIVPVHENTLEDRKSTRLNSSHVSISYAVFCLKKKKKHTSRQ